MEKKSTPLVDEHLQSMQGMQEVGTDDFFYTRLKARMLARQSSREKEHSQQGWSFPLKPVWVVGTLVLLLAVNGFMLSQQFKAKETKSTASTSSLQNFAESYDQTISSSY
jgi:multisubunit Na+/H+ antiporter MnhC subunit